MIAAPKMTDEQYITHRSAVIPLLKKAMKLYGRLDEFEQTCLIVDSFYKFKNQCQLSTYIYNQVKWKKCEKKVKILQLEGENDLIDGKPVEYFTNLDYLDGRDKEIVHKRFYENKKLREIAADYGVSIQMVHKVLKRCYRKLKCEIIKQK
jgi:hypothetical protein